MKKIIISVLAILLCLASIFTSINTRSFAYNDETTNNEDYVAYSNIITHPKATRSSITTKEINKVNEILNILNSISLNNDSKSVERSYDIKEYTLETDNLKNLDYWNIETDKYYIHLGTENSEIEGIYNKDMSANIAEDISEENAREIIQNIYEQLELPIEYELCFMEKADDYTWEADFQAKVDGVYNPYDAVKVFFNPTTKEIISLTRFNQKYVENKVRTIIAMENLESMKDSLENEINTKLNTKLNTNENNFKLDLSTAEITFTRPNTFFISDIEAEGQSRNIVKAWKINCTDNLIVYIDYYTGEIVKGDYSRYEEAQAQNANYYPQYDPDCAASANVGFQRLGYNSSIAGASNNEIINWISDSAGAHYGYFIVTHGHIDGNGNACFVSSDGTAYNRNNVSGNWHLVFIDACYSKSNETLAQGFKISSAYSGRAYLGWYGEVDADPDTTFQSFFWREEVTRTTIQQAAKNAASRVPGSGSTPVRFSGDTSWYGYAK